MPRSPSNKSHTLSPKLQREAEDVQKAFGAKVRQLRQTAELTIEDLAELSALHPSYVGGVERGVRNLSLFNIWRLANGLKVSSETLMSSLPKAAPLAKTAKTAPTASEKRTTDRA